jgi:lambda family phage holin
MNNMPDRPETWAWLSAWLQMHMPALYAGGLAFMISVWRVIYSGGRLRQLALESPLCGLLGVGVSYGAEMIGAPQGAGVFIACMVGLLGVETSRAAAQRLLDRKVDSL